MVKKTTGWYRQEALKAEGRLEFGKAKKYYGLAIKKYPKSQRVGELYKADIASLKRSMKDL